MIVHFSCYLSFSGWLFMKEEGKRVIYIFETSVSLFVLLSCVVLSCWKPLEVVLELHMNYIVPRTMNVDIDRITWLIWLITLTILLFQPRFFSADLASVTSSKFIHFPVWIHNRNISVSALSRLVNRSAILLFACILCTAPVWNSNLIQPTSPQNYLSIETLRVDSDENKSLDFRRRCCWFQQP